MDGSFKKPGAIPFKWEIRPGVPKPRQPQEPLYEPRSGSFLPKHHHEPPLQPPSNHKSPYCDTPTRKLRPPPAGFYFQPSIEPRSKSFRARSQRILARPECVSPSGCFPSPLVKRKNEKKNVYKFEFQPGTEQDYNSDIETVSRWSVSSRKSLSPFRDSPMSSSFSSYQSSPRLMVDADWAGFGLF
ncbi:hydroxyproline-rich glycoprotein family protein [Abeliophyllum distichum]|uniref:Hydroxyproline-rich glycoprotein family protein n=1 Tax=Abeliophyllum distichum TaxID=126358 RepID=A0ABD1S8U0_9LAMI